MSTSFGFFDDFNRLGSQMDRMMRWVDQSMNVNPSFYDVGDFNVPLLLTSGLGGGIGSDIGTLGSSSDVQTKGAGEEQKQLETGGKGVQGGQQLQTTTGGGALGQQRGRGLLNVWVPRCDIVETDKEYKITAELPGVPKENIACELNPRTNVVTITGHHEAQKEHREGDFVRRERSSGEFRRAIRLPQDAAKTDMQAKLEHGVLCVCVPKIPKEKLEEEEKKKHQQIPIQ